MKSLILAIAVSLTALITHANAATDLIPAGTPCLVKYPVYLWNSTLMTIIGRIESGAATVTSSYYYKRDPQTPAGANNPQRLWASITTASRLHGEVLVETDLSEPDPPMALVATTPEGTIESVLLSPSVSSDPNQWFQIDSKIGTLSHPFLNADYTTQLRVLGTPDWVGVGGMQRPEIYAGKTISRFFQLPTTLTENVVGRIVFEVEVAFAFDGNPFATKTISIPFDGTPVIAAMNDQLVREGTSLALQASVEGLSAPLFLWEKDGVILSEDVSSRIERPASTFADAGVYRITASQGSRTASASCEVAIIARENDQVSELNVGDSLTLTGGAGIAKWQWFKDGRAIPGANAPTLNITNATPSSAGRYVLEIANGTQVMRSGAFTVKVSSTPVFEVPVLDQPIPPAVRVAKPVTIIVPFDEAPSRAPTSWTASNLPPGLVISKTTGVISGTPSKAGVYTVTLRAANSAGSSLPLLVTINVGAEVSQAGTWYGLANPGAGIGATATRIDLSTTNTGAASGKVTMGSAAFGFTGKLVLGEDDTAKLSVIVRRPSPMSALRLAISINLISGELEGQMIDDTEPAALVIQGWRKKTSMPTAAGYHTWLSSSPVVVEGHGPEGLIQGTTTVNGSTAAASSVVILPDENGTVALTTSSGVGAEGQYLIFIARYSGQSLSQKRITSNGSLSGVMTIAQDAEHSITSELSWVKGVQTKSRYYNDGFKSTAFVTGAKFIPTPKGKRYFGITDDSGRVALSFTGGGIEESAASPDIEFGVTAANRLSIPTKASGYNPFSTSFSYNGTTGVFTGSFLLPEPSPSGRRITYRGIIVQTTDGVIAAGGHFVAAQMPTLGQTWATSPVLSGAVVLTVW